jgi:hypothetical protein
MRELSANWYEELFLPAIALYRKSGIRAPFPEVYRAWMRVWRREIQRDRDAGLEETLAILLKKRRWKRLLPLR